MAERMGYENYLPGTDEELIDLLLASGHPSMEGITVKSLKENGPTLPSDYDMRGCGLSGLDFVDYYLEVLLAVTDAFLAVFTAALVGWVELLAFYDSIFGRGFE